MPVQVTTCVLSTYLVGNQAWRGFGGIIRSEAGVFHPCIAMLNLQVYRHSRREKKCLGKRLLCHSDDKQAISGSSGRHSG